VRLIADEDRPVHAGHSIAYNPSMRRLTPNELVDRVPWEVGFDMLRNSHDRERRNRGVVNTETAAS
jgi:hypothetical protein